MLMRNVLFWVVILLGAEVSSATSTNHTNTAEQLAKHVASRPAGEGRVGTMHFRLENSNRQTRTREAMMLHSKDQDVERIAIFFTEPSMIEETAFLSINHEVQQDENWLYLPATERIRRLPSSDRGDYFLGTDLTYGDINDNFKFAFDDWDFSLEATTQPEHVLIGKAKSNEVRQELGYSSFRASIDMQSAFPLWVEYTDKDGELLKRVDVLKIDLVDGVHTAMHFIVQNVQSGHKTDVKFTNMRHIPNLDDDVFDPNSLSYGVPEIDEN